MTVIALAVGVGGSIASLQSHAETPFATAEPENGTLSAPAVAVNDAAASNGKAVQFAVGSAPGACNGALNTPGGPDSAGVCWPAAYNTGYPRGLPGDTRTPVTLTPYTGLCDIRTDNLVIDSKLLNCGGMLVYARNVTIKNSKIVGHIFTNSATASLTLIDTEVDGGSGHARSIGVNNVTLLRVNVYGNQHTLQCSENCTATDSYMHDQYPGGRDLGWHQNSFLTNGGSNLNMIHNTMGCTGGCTAVIGLIPDYNISGFTADHNLIVASPDSSYCLYGGGNSGNKPGVASSIVFRNNVVQRGANGKCGAYGPVTYFNPNSPGNQWVNNTWSDGSVLPSAN
ncbi:MAG TPA: hypothetical protein VF575_00130 [Candidatus Saccharimonadales bacterium]